jgi:phage-related protein
MPPIAVLLYREEDGTVPLLEWFDQLQPKALAKCRVKLERLNELGNELRRPEADFLRDGIYELRVGLGGQNYRMLYFFWADQAVVMTHGLVKERAVPVKDIERAIECSKKFKRNPERHTHRE